MAPNPSVSDSMKSPGHLAPIRMVAEHSATQRGIKEMLPALTIDLAAPLAIYVALQVAGLSMTWSLAGAGAAPVARIASAAVHSCRLNRLAVLVLGALVVGVILTLLTGNPRLAIARDAAIGLAVGTLFAGSLAMPRPLMFHIIRSFRGAGIEAEWDRLPRLRRDLRLMTAMTGGLCVLDAAVRVAIAYTLPIHAAATLVHFQPIVLVGLLMQIGKSQGERIRRYTHPDGSAYKPGSGMGQRGSRVLTNAGVGTLLRTMLKS